MAAFNANYENYSGFAQGLAQSQASLLVVARDVQLPLDTTLNEHISYLDIDKNKKHARSRLASNTLVPPSHPLSKISDFFGDIIHQTVRGLAP